MWNTVLQLSLLAFTAAPTAAASAWGFTDATVSVQTKGAGVGSGLKEKCVTCFTTIDLGSTW